ncbi:ATP-binding cassette domain-containing protein [Paraferrimonas sedimenticola]|uniref:ABC transporter ATP-binding protein n=1 Tax=Paraferrimonas sedimenticola TaxID=375674 RepID=A0AA37W032_9GAMM|nr:ATP-binding cassette domain-containing protein [Paraferrimonas sedimenticola]GLP94843.1 ABC transporter ATP-binding protein [Paraferrimonas sedimenticola]
MTALLEVNGISKRYFSGYRRFKRRYKDALKPTSFELQQGQTLAILGQTGSGKTTLARILAGAESPTQGEILFRGEPLAEQDHKQRCRCIRMIFQDPSTSLNPKLTIGELLSEPLKFSADLDDASSQTIINNNLRQVGLLPDHAEFYPHMLSVGQKQRVAVARALMLEPEIIIADEALADLDLSIRSQIVNLLLSLQQKLGISFIIVTQDLNIIRHMSDELMIMADGEVVEHGKSQQLLDDPQHEYTQRLLSQTPQSSAFGGKARQ